MSDLIGEAIEEGGWLSPDCRDGNHQKCDGVAWDPYEDEPTECACPHPQHRAEH